MAQFRVIRGGQSGTEAVAPADLAVADIEPKAPDEQPIPVSFLIPDTNGEPVLPVAAPLVIDDQPNPAPLSTHRSRAQRRHYEREAQSEFSAPPDYGRYGMGRKTNTANEDSFVEPLPANAVAIVSRKGGVGTTTITAHLSAMFAGRRPGAVTAIDADIETGPLSWLLSGRVAPEFELTPELLKSRDVMLTQALPSPSGVEIIGAPASNHTDPKAMAAFGRAVKHHFDMVFMDVHPQLGDPSNRALLSAANVAVVVTGPNREGARAAEQMLDWLEENGHDPLNVVVVINGVPSYRGRKFVSFLSDHFSRRVGAVVTLPLVKELTVQSGHAVKLEDLPPTWRQGLDELAGAVLKRLRASAVLDLTAGNTSENGSSQGGAELRVLHSMSDHNASHSGGNAETSSPRGSRIQPTRVVSAQPNTKGE